MPPSASNFSAILRILVAHEVRFLTVGGVGAVLQGAPIFTFDLDIVHARSKANCLRLAKALAAMGAHYRGHSKRIAPTTDLLLSEGHHLLNTVHGPLDVLGTIGKSHDYRELVADSKAMLVEAGLRVRVLQLQALIQIKTETARGKDRAVLPILRQTLAEQQRSPSESKKGGSNSE